jgi:hypothetical protein
MTILTSCIYLRDSHATKQAERLSKAISVALAACDEILHPCFQLCEHRQAVRIP